MVDYMRDGYRQMGLSMGTLPDLRSVTQVPGRHRKTQNGQAVVHDMGSNYCPASGQVT